MAKRADRRARFGPDCYGSRLRVRDNLPLRDNRGVRAAMNVESGSVVRSIAFRDAFASALALSVRCSIHLVSTVMAVAVSVVRVERNHMLGQ